MSTDRSYLFKSQCLGFRNWQPADLKIMTAINADPQVMEFFPALQSEADTTAFMARMQQQLAEKGFCYFAVDRLEDNTCIGFTGLSEKTFEAAFTPCIDIGWRFSRHAWHKGYATEAAIRCLSYAFVDLKLDKVVAMAPAVNVRSIRVMEQAGMHKVMDFKHVLLKGHATLEDCVLYGIVNNGGI